MRWRSVVAALLLFHCGNGGENNVRDGGRDSSVRDEGVDVVDAATNELGTIATDGSMDAIPSGETAVSVDATGDLSCLPTTCEATERCFDGLDNNCNGSVDESCPCIPGTTSRCLAGRADPSLPICAWGEMNCAGSGEFGTWSACSMGTRAGDGGSAYGCRRIGIMGAPGANPSSNFQRWLEMQGAIATRFHAMGSAPALQRAQLETFDLVVVDWLQRDYTAAESTVLRDWVREGGALMVMTGHDSGATAQRHNSLLVSLGLRFQLMPPINGPAMLLMHPTTTTADGMSVLPPVTFFGGLETISDASSGGMFTPMARIGSTTVGLAGTMGMGRVLLFGDEWIEFDSEWSTMPAITQLWLNVVRWLSPQQPILPICG